MAKKTKTTTIVEEPADENPAALVLDAAPERDEDSEKINEFLEQFGGKEYKVRVEQYSREDKCWEHLDTYAVDGFEAYAVCKSFGPGRYRMSFLDEHGKYILGGKPQIRIGGRAVVAGAQAPASPLTDPMVIMMLDQANKSRAEMLEMFKVLATKPEPTKSSTNEVMDLMVKLNALNPKEKPDDTLKKLQEQLMFRMIEKGIEGDGGGGGEGGGILSDIKEALPMIKEMFAAKFPQRPAQANPAPVRVQLPHGQETKENITVSPILDALKPYVAIFKAKAENGIDQDRAAAYLIDELYDTVIPLVKKHIPLASLASEESIIESLVGRAKNPAELDGIFAFAPELVPHKEWVVSVINKAVALLETPETEEASHV